MIESRFRDERGRDQLPDPSESQLSKLKDRRTLLAALAFGPLFARAATAPCPPSPLSIDGTAGSAFSCGNVSATLRNAGNTGILGAGISEGSLVAQAGQVFDSRLSGQTITGKRFTSECTLSGSNITIKGCLFDIPAGSSSKGITVSGGTGNVLEDCTIRVAGGSGSAYTHVLITGGSVTLRRCDVSRAENNVSINGGTGHIIEDSFIHDSSNASNPAGHRDCIEVYGGSNMIFRRSTLIHPAGETSVINIAPWSGNAFVDGLTIDDCYLDGGGSGTVLKDLQSSGYIRNVRVQNCRFGGHTKGDWNDYWNLNDYEGSAIVTTEAALAANSSAILWVGNVYLYTQSSPFGYYSRTASRDGQSVKAGLG